MSDSLIVTIVQSDLHWESIDANLAMFEEKIWENRQETDLIVLPEMFTTGFSMKAKELAEPINTRTMKWMKQIAAETKAVICGSYIVKDGGKFYNRFYAVYPDVGLIKYDKKHLFTLAGEHEAYTPGASQVVFEVKGWRIMPQICYDLRFPVWSRMHGELQYDVIMYVASWPAPRIHAWDTLLQARAIENQAYCIGVNRIGTDGQGHNYPGHSAIYDYLGKSVIAPSNEDHISAAVLDLNLLKTFREKFPFQSDADSFNLI